METRGQKAVTTMKEFQAEGSWVPVTPLKPTIPQPDPICKNGQNNGLMGQPVLNGSTCSLSSAENSSFAVWDMPLPWKNNNGANSSYPSIGFENMSFGELLAMNGPALAPSLISDRLEDCGGAVMSSTFHGLNVQPGTSSLDCSSVIRDQQGLQQLNQQFVPHSSAYPWSQRSVNSSPRTMHISGEQFCFAPQTPDSRWKADTMVARESNRLKEHEVANAGVDSQGVNSKPIAETATCSSPGKVSITGGENHNPDLGDSHYIDLNKTPLRKKRRKRYQPKVAKENKPKRTPRPKTPGEKEGPRQRRKYVRKSTVDTSSNPVVGGTKTTENKPKKRASRTCKKSLNFDLDGEEKAKDDTNADPQTSQMGKVTGNLMGINVGEISSPCGSSNEGMQRGSKRVFSNITGNVDPGNVATNHGTYYPPNYIHNGVPNFGIPDIHKKQRIEQGQTSHASKYYYHNVGTSNQVEMLRRSGGNKVQLLNTWVDIMRLRTTSQPKGPLHAHNLEPLEGVPLFSRGESSGKGKAPRRKKSDILTTHQPTSVDPNTGVPIEDSNKKPKARRRSKKQNPVFLHNDNQLHRRTPGFVPMSPLSMAILLEAITVGLKQLDLNKEQRVALVPHPQNALVLYRNEGTLVPFEPQFDPVRKRGQRAKVELDDETTRVWMLLLENIDNEGIDGTTEEKRKWWENERSVFHGRVDSFIARMRLVQGDRRFTPWKGSVLDSVIGVFLTQNVSDHLSSSAFMSLAARFPIKPNSGENASFEEIIEPDVCIIQPDESEPTYARLSNEIDHTEIKGDISCQVGVSRAASGSVGPIDCSSQSSLKANDELRFNKDNNTHIIDTEAANNVGDYRAWDDATSSLLSMMSSQNSVNSIPQSLASSSQSDCFCCSTSFLGLLKMAESPMLHDSYNQILGYDPEKARNIHSSDHQVCKESDFQLKNTTSIQMIEVESKSSAEVTTGSTVTIDRTTSDQKEASGHNYVPGGNSSNVADANRIKSKRQMPEKDMKNAYDWDNLRKQAQANGGNKERPLNTRDSVDWEAVRHADVSVLADTIKERGMSNVLAGRIKDLLDKLVKDHGSTDLEWLRDIPPDKAKEYLLSFRGLGLKSVECVRLLTLHHLAFPVDTNVGRIAVRLGWVPLQPLPESIQLHLLEMYPIMESIQQYLWPRLCKLDQRTLYELHYHLITFGKVFCTKRQPNCNACPLRGECRHFASAFASARLALPSPEERRIVASNNNTSIPRDPHNNIKPLPLPLPPPSVTTNHHPQTNFSCNKDATIVEVPSTPLSLSHLTQPTFNLERQSRVHCEPIVEVPASPEPEPEPEQILCDIEDSVYEDPNEIPTIELNMEKFTQTLQNVMQANRELQESGMSRALVALTPEAASIPMPKLKNISRLRTEHHVYELPDTHPLLIDWDKREHDDPCSYLLAIWTPGETANTIQPPNRRCSSDDPTILCNEETCAYCSSHREANSQTVRGTILIPCRTAMRGSFPLNGTYFQVNEVFADHESSLNPVNVPRSWLWNLPRRTVYFGTSVPTIFRGLTTEEIQHCFWRGFVCVRGFDKKSRAPRPLMARLHFPASKMPKGTKIKVDEE